MQSTSPAIRYYQGQDGCPLAARVWECPDPLADVVVLHGIISHGGWYLSSCAHLAAHGFHVHALERRGSGLNVEGRGDVDDWRTWLTDVTCYLARIAQPRPRILLGISWGGILATAMARQHPGLLSGLGLLCPGLFSFKAANGMQRAALRLAAALGLGRFRVSVPLKDPALFTGSPADQAYIAQDPLALRKITVRFALSNLELLRQATQRPEQIHVPVLLMLAGRDPITDNQQTEAFVQRMGHPQKRVIQYAEASHTLEFEQDPSPYFHDLTHWCRQVAQQAATGDAANCRG